MRPSLKQLAADVREVWSPPGGRAWSISDVRIVKLLKAIEEMPDLAATDQVGQVPARENEP